MKMLMTPIETLYKGVKFRSRLEARHALLFDLLGIKWEYEVEGYRLPNGKWYLPDFFLPEVYIRSHSDPGVYLEVKNSKDAMYEKSSIFKKFGKSLVIACGTPELENYCVDWLYESWIDRWDNFMYFKYCSKCDIYEIEYSEGSYNYCRKCKKPADGEEKWSKAVSFMKSYRF